jgi:hypothetical protein
MSRAIDTDPLLATLLLVSFEILIEDKYLQSVAVAEVATQNLAWKSAPGQATDAFRRALVGFRFEMLLSEILNRGSTIKLKTLAILSVDLSMAVTEHSPTAIVVTTPFASTLQLGVSLFHFTGVPIISAALAKDLAVPNVTFIVFAFDGGVAIGTTGPLEPPPELGGVGSGVQRAVNVVP